MRGKKLSEKLREKFLPSYKVVQSVIIISKISCFFAHKQQNVKNDLSKCSTPAGWMICDNKFESATKEQLPNEMAKLFA